MELGLTYSHYSKNRLDVNGYSFYDVIIIGRLQVDEIKRDILMPTLTLRQNLSPEADFEVIVPYKFRVDDTFKYCDGGTEKVVREVGIGDIELLLNLQPELQQDDVQNMITLGIKVPTGLDPYEAGDSRLVLGTGHWGAKASFMRMKQIDPVVLFGGISYFANSPRNQEEYGTIDPGNTWQYSVGMAFAINDRFSLNARLEQAFTGQTKVDGTPEKGSDMNAATLYLGSSYITDSGQNIDFTVGAGLTEDAADLTVKIAWPFSF